MMTLVAPLPPCWSESPMRGAATAALAKLTSTGKVELTTVPPLVLDVALLIVSANARLLLWQKSASPLLFLATNLTSMLV